MWTLPLPEHNKAMEELITALTYVDGKLKYELTDAEKVLIEELYNQYEALEGQYDESLNGDKLLQTTQDAIHDGYGEVQETGRLKKLRSRLLLAADRCPCCSIGDATDLDHHLPQSVFKALSVYSSNLVPLCHKCNNKKRTVSGKDPDKKFIHAYYDEIPEEKSFLIATTSVSSQGLKVEFNIVQVDGMEETLYKQLTYQVNRVGLYKRLQKEINIFLMPFYTSLEMHYSGDHRGQAVKEFLMKNYEFFKEKMGLNEWRTALLFSLANNDDFCNGGFMKLYSKKIKADDE